MSKHFPNRQRSDMKKLLNKNIKSKEISKKTAINYSEDINKRLSDKQKNV